MKETSFLFGISNVKRCKIQKQLRKWLWEKVKEPNIKKIYNPDYLVKNLGDKDDLNTFLDNWK